MDPPPLREYVLLSMIAAERTLLSEHRSSVRIPSEPRSERDALLRQSARGHVIC